MDASLNENRTEIPLLGLRNYWYPAIAAWRIRRKPKAISLLGEKIALFRDNGKIFALSEDGDTFVIQSGQQFKVLGKNPLDELSMATPAIARGSLIIRTASKLYRIAKTE